MGRFNQAMQTDKYLMKIKRMPFDRLMEEIRRVKYDLGKSNAHDDRFINAGKSEAATRLTTINKYLDSQLTLLST